MALPGTRSRDLWRMDGSPAAGSHPCALQGKSAAVGQTGSFSPVQSGDPRVPAVFVFCPRWADLRGAPGYGTLELYPVVIVKF